MKKCCPFFFLCFAGFLLCVAGCSNEKSADISRKNVIVNRGENGIEVTSADGKISIGGGEKEGHIKIKADKGKDIDLSYYKNKLADGFPADVPIYSPSEIKMSQAFQGRNAVASLRTKEKIDTVSQYYKSALPENGWTMGEDVSLGTMILLHARKDNVKLNISVSAADNQTNINLAMSDK